MKQVDVIVVGAGIGGLTCAALCAKYHHSALCVEAHDRPGGVAHSFARPFVRNKKSDDDDDDEQRPFTFDSGPSLVSGLSSRGTNNPLRQVLDALDVADTIDWKLYDGWVVHDIASSSSHHHQTEEETTTKKKSFKITTGDSGAWEDEIERHAGIDARRAFVQFRQQLLRDNGLSQASAVIPPFALRGDNALQTLRTLGPSYFWKLLQIGTQGTLLTGPFSKVMDHYRVHDPFVRQWFDYLSFALSGCDAAHTQAAAVAYMMTDLHQPGAVLDYPLGGMDAIVQALVTGLERHGGSLQLNARVERFLLSESDNGRAECHGVVLSNGQIIRARRGVVCNAPIWNMARILQDSVAVGDHHQNSTTTTTTTCAVTKAVNEIQRQADQMCMTGSFMHLHLGIPKDGLPDDLECHHSVLDFQRPITAEQNMVIISIPSVFDPLLAPEGYHVIHAYTAACDNFEDWEDCLGKDGEVGKVGASPNSAAAAAYRSSSASQTLKEQKAEVLWRAIECVIPDVRQRAQRPGSVVQIGTPLTHRRYNQRFRGTYGPSNSPGKDVWELPGAATPIKGLWACGDTTFPGTCPMVSTKPITRFFSSHQICNLYVCCAIFHWRRNWAAGRGGLGDDCRE